MENKDLQVENGNFTRIVNPLIEELIKLPFKGCELAVAIFIIRKTYGFQKIQDEISLSQFEKGLNRSRQTIVTALENLQLVKVARLVKKGDSKRQSNIWTINKYYRTWELVNMARLVKRKRGTSLTEAPQLVVTARHTKEITKEITKETNTYVENESFGSFWSIYPKKADKKKAEAKWSKLPEETKKIILEDIPKRKDGRKWRAGFVENPMTYLNGERWNDEIEKTAKTTLQAPTNKYAGI
jgi:phage replication O-like protein O